ncbi:MAG TPA: YciI family protein [Bradyrhizobium sp.]|nr:YciI family protein [Bradyrhizobium sp.]
MRFMMLMIPLGFETAPPDVKLDPERMAAMMRYNGELRDAGVLITLDGLHPQSMGSRVSFATGEPVVTDGPFTESKEVLGGYWMIEVNSRAEAIEWAKKCPASANEIIEIRQVHEVTDYPEEIQQVATDFIELQPRSAASR